MEMQQSLEILVLVCIYLVTLSLSLLGSGSILAMAVRRRQCCCDQLRPLVLLSLADFLGAAVLIPTMALHLLPTQHFGAAHGFCLYGRMFGMMFYAISLLMVLVYACEVNQAVRGWRVTQEDSSYCPRFQLALPYTLAWLLPCLVVLALIVLSSRPLSSEAFLQPLPQAGTDSSGASNLSCSSCLILIHLSHNSCYKAPRQPSPPLASQHSRKDSSIFFLVFLALVVSACVVLYCRVKRWQCQDRHGLRSEGFASRSHVTRSFQLVLVFCWMPACLLVVLSFTRLQLSTLFPLLVATALTAPLQGFLHSLVYGWLRSSFRQEVAGERLPLYCSPDLKASFDDSLAASG
ncbi:transmembrane protein 116-like [Pituophis catenifer annectens]|uniref:transmembrane protein 116-like n=1 Tax=Pituophis catenifer annectens TaxID=94852 RepID=UPI0039955AB3